MDNMKVLYQGSPVVLALTLAYTVPVASTTGSRKTQTLITSIHITESAGATSTAAIWLVPDSTTPPVGASPYVVVGGGSLSLTANETMIIDSGWTLPTVSDSGDSYGIYVKTLTGLDSYTIFGIEITND